MGILRMVSRHVKRACELKNLLILNFLCVLINLFFLVMQLNHGIWPVESYFKPSMTTKDKGTMVRTLKAFTNALDAANLTYMAYGGTLIGSWRHHGFVPWDDDVDVMLNASQKLQVFTALQSLEPDYKVYMWGDLDTPSQWKFYLNSLDKMVHVPFKWPYIDIFFFKENETHIWDEVGRFSSEYCFDKAKVFPLEDRPFEDMKLKSPCDTGSVLGQNYKTDLCRSRQFSHMTELPMFTFNTKDIPCQRLYHLFPFVQRTYINGVMNETLKLSHYTLQTLTLPTFCRNGRHHRSQ